MIVRLAVAAAMLAAVSGCTKQPELSPAEVDRVNAENTGRSLVEEFLPRLGEPAPWNKAIWVEALSTSCLRAGEGIIGTAVADEARLRLFTLACTRAAGTALLR